MKGIMLLWNPLLVAICLLIPHQSLGVENWSQRGLSFLESQRFDDAIKAFSIAIETAYNNRGTAWFYKGDYDRAIADCSKALELNPRYAEAYNNRGTAWFYKGDYDRAIADCTKALELNPRYAEAYHQLAWILAICPDKRYQNATKAVELAQKAVELNPEAGFLDTLAMTYKEAGKLADAIEAQKRAVALLKKEGKTEELAGYIKRLESYKARKRLREEHIAQLQKEKKDPFKGPGRMPPQIGKGKPTANKQGFYPYTIQICSLRHRERSNLVATNLRKKRDPAFTCHAYIPGKGDWYRVFIGYYGTLKEAQKAASALKKRRFRYANVVRKPYAIQVGLSDSDQELKKLEGDLRSKGYVPYSIPGRQANGKIRLLIGAFKTQKEAFRLTKKLQKEGFKPKVVQR